jgi:hypothetical protein
MQVNTKHTKFNTKNTKNVFFVALVLAFSFVLAAYRQAGLC